MAAAAASGKLETIQFLRTLSPPCPMDASATRSALWADQPHCLALLRSQQAPCPWTVASLSGAVGHHSLEAVQMARALEPPCPWDSGACNAAIAENNAEILTWLLENGAPRPNEHSIGQALAHIHGSGDDAIFPILNYHHLLLPAKAQVRLQSIQYTWDMVLQLVQWAQTTQTVSREALAQDCRSGSRTARSRQKGLLVQLALLPEELVYRIGSAAGLYYNKGSRIFPRRCLEH